MFVPISRGNARQRNNMFSTLKHIAGISQPALRSTIKSHEYITSTKDMLFEVTLPWLISAYVSMLTNCEDIRPYF
jgi:hypothetical protein